MSNIIGVFNPPPLRDLPIEATECLPCTFIQLCVSVGGGLWLNLNSPFKGKDGKIDLIKHPMWWQKSLKGTGILLFGFGAYRFGEFATKVYEKWDQSKTFN